MGATKEELVAALKELQRTNYEKKQAWWSLCDQEHAGVKDPNRHDEATLQAFLAAHQGSSIGDGDSSGGAPPGLGGGGGGKGAGRPARPSSNPLAGIGAYASGGGFGGGFGGGGGLGPQMGGGPTGGPMDTMMAEWVKLGQRSSPNFKAAWKLYCGIYGGQLNDPARQGPEYVAGFIDYVGQLTQATLAQEAMGMMGMVSGGAYGGHKRGMDSSSFMPMTKRAKQGGEHEDEEMASLIERVKTLQRQDPAKKKLWWDFTDENHGGVHDPSRHDKAVLLEFLASHE